MKKSIRKKYDEPSVKKPNSQESKSPTKSSNTVSWAVFLFSLSIVLISLVTVVFPALIASNNSSIHELKNLGLNPIEVNPLILGVWAIPLFVTNFVVFALTIVYFKKKLEGRIKKSIDFVFEFEVSKKIAIVIIVILLGIYVAASAGDLTTVEDWEDYPGVKTRVDRWEIEQITTGFEPHVRFFLIKSSMFLFGYDRIIPFIASISLLLLTYFFTKEIAKKRFAGIIAMVILLQSNVFLTYDSTVAYTNFWILFYLLSLYLIYKAWPLSPISYLLSMFSKALTAMFLPMSLFYIYRSSLSRRLQHQVLP